MLSYVDLFICFPFNSLPPNKLVCFVQIQAPKYQTVRPCLQNVQSLVSGHSERVFAIRSFADLAHRLLSRYDFLGLAIVLFSTAISINAGVSAGLVVIVASQARGTVARFHWALRNYVELEQVDYTSCKMKGRHPMHHLSLQALNSIERIDDCLNIPNGQASCSSANYARLRPPPTEPPAIVENNRLLAH